MKKIILSVVLASFVLPSAGFAQSASMPRFPNVADPINAQAGKCYAVRLREAVYTSTPRQVLQQDAYDTYEIRQAVEGPNQVRQTETRPAHTVYEAIAPQFETYTETVVTRPGYETLSAPPVETKNYTDSYVVREPRLVWRRGANLSGVRRVDSATGEVYCLVEEAARTVNVTRTVRTSVGDVRRTPIPPRTQQITRQRLVRDGSYRAIPVGPTVANITYNDVTTGSARRITNPAVSTTINMETLATDERYELVEVVCDPATLANMSTVRTTSGMVARSGVTTPGHVVSLRSVQSALKAQGLYRGPIDGILGNDTSRALREFQRRNGINSPSLLSIETLSRLGL
jgi:hypothetical protein